MPPKTRSVVREYVRHAEIYGPELILETALSDGDLASHPGGQVEALAVIARRLKDLSPKWASPLRDKTLAVAWLKNGHSEVSVASITGFSRPTLRRWRTESPFAVPERSEPTTLGSCLDPPNLSTLGSENMGSVTPTSTGLGGAGGRVAA